MIQASFLKSAIDHANNLGAGFDGYVINGDVLDEENWTIVETDADD